MIRSTKNYSKKTKNKKRTDRTLRQMVKAKLYRQNHTQKHTHTHSQKGRKGKKYIFHCSQSPPLEFGMIRCPFRYSTDAGTSSWLWSFNPLLLRLLGEISLSILCLHSSSGSASDFAPPLHVGHPPASVLRPDRMWLKSCWLGGPGSLRLGGGRGMEIGRASCRERV